MKLNTLQFLFILTVLVSFAVFSSYIETPSPTTVEPVVKERTFASAKRSLNKIYSADRTTFYCGCKYDEQNKVDLASCGYKVRLNANRAQRVEWEHIVPASYFGVNMPCWKEGGRENCSKTSNAFSNFEGDMHNLVPEVGELNGDRGNKIHGTVLTENFKYGSCNFKINSIRAEPHDGIKGDIARIWLYMSSKYSMFISSEMRSTFETWSKNDPVDDKERWRNNEIKKIQGDANPLVL